MMRLSLLAGLAAATAGLAAVFLAALLAPSSPFGILVNALVPIPDLATARYEHALDLARSAREPDRGRAIAAAEAAARQEVHAAPRRPEGWLRLAVARALDGRDLGGAGAALKGSYQASRFDRRIGPTRVRFALEAWSGLSADVQALAISEIKVLYRSARTDAAASERQRLVDAVLAARNPLGRAAGEAALASVGWTRPKTPA